MSGGVEAALKALEDAVQQAIEAKQITEDFKWTSALDIPGRAPWMMLLTVAEVTTSEERKARARGIASEGEIGEKE